MTVETPSSSQPRRRRWGWRNSGYLLAAVLAAVIAAAGGLAWYASTPRFAARVHRTLVGTLERATGGRVEIGSFHWSVRGLTIEIGNLTIHGREAPGEAPFFHVDHLTLHASVISFFTPKVALASLSAERPSLHLILYPDGTTNQPRPGGGGGAAFPHTLLKLAIGSTRVRDGVVLLNQRAIPWEMAAGPLHLEMHYRAGEAEYHAIVETDDLTFRLKNAAAAHSRLRATIDLGRNALRVQNLEVETGRSRLTVTGQLENFSRPSWQITLRGSIDLRQVGAATGVDELRDGTAGLNLSAEGKPGDGGAPDFRVDGHIDLRSAAWQSPWLRLRQVDLRTNVLVDNAECSLTDFSSRLEDQSRIDGSLVIQHCFGASAPAARAATGRAGSKSWLARHPKFNPRDLLARLHRRHTPAAAAAKSQEALPLEAALRAHVAGVTLPMVLQAVAPREYWNIGFTTATTGDVTAHWRGPGHRLDVHGDLMMAAPPRLNGLIPVSGNAHADYLGDHRHLVIEQANEYTPATEVHASGLLTLFTHDLRSNLRLDATGRDLGEFDRLLTVLDLRETPKGQPHALPLKLLGSASFHGDVHGSFFALEAVGHLTSQKFEMVVAHAARPGQAAPPGRRLTWDGFAADVSYKPAELIVRNGELVRGNAVIHTALDLLPDHTGPDDYTFDKRTRITASAATGNAPLADLQSVAGTSYPTSGELTASAHVAGVEGDLEGAGRAVLRDGAVEGQPISTASLQMAAHGHVLEASHVDVAAAGGTARGQLRWDTESGLFEGHVTGERFDLARVVTLQRERLPIGGSLGFHVQASGTTAAPVATGAAQIQGLTLDRQPMGSVQAEAHLQDGVVTATSRADLLHAQVAASGQVDLRRNDFGRAQLRFTGLETEPLLRSLVSTAIDSAAPLDGRITIAGPLRQLARMQGQAHLHPVSITIAHRAIYSGGPVEVSLQDGKVQLQPLQIEGQDMNLTAGGTVDLLQKNRLRLHSEGTLDAGLASLISPRLESAGQIHFMVNAFGTVRQPDLRGRAQVRHVSLHLPNITNGLTDLNGELLFDQDRMVVQQLTGSSGGGQLQMKGFVGYRNGVFVDLTATSKDVRIRYPRGVSSSVDAKLRLLGTSDSMLLSGNVKIMRFGIGSSVDLASLAGGGGEVSGPIDPTSPLNRVRLDIHVTSAPQVGFQNSFASLAGDVNLRIRGTLENPSVLGRVDITEGSASFAGTKYRLQQGDIVFNNPVTISPEINLEASARVQNYDIIISLHGPPSKLDISYRSEPPLTQADVLALLALGRTNEQATMYGEQQQAGANLTSEALLGGALNAAVSSRVQKLFGMGSVRVDPNFVGTLGESTARITVEEQVGPSLTLTFATNVNTTAQQLIQAQYDLTRNVSVIAVRDEANVFSMYLQIRARHK